MQLGCQKIVSSPACGGECDSSVAKCTTVANSKAVTLKAKLCVQQQLATFQPVQNLTWYWDCTQRWDSRLALCFPHIHKSSMQMLMSNHVQVLVQLLTGLHLRGIQL